MGNCIATNKVANIGNNTLSRNAPMFCSVSSKAVWAGANYYGIHCPHCESWLENGLSLSSSGVMSVIGNLFHVVMSDSTKTH